MIFFRKSREPSRVEFEHPCRPEQATRTVNGGVPLICLTHQRAFAACAAIQAGLWDEADHPPLPAEQIAWLLS